MNAMNRLFASIVLISLFSLGILGFLGIHETHNGMLCVSEILHGTRCTEQAGSLGLVAFHFGALKHFSEGIFTSLLLFFSVFLGFEIYNVLKRKTLLPGTQRNSSYNSVSIEENRFMRWLGLHELSPALL